MVRCAGWVCAAAALTLLARARCDVIFRVPEVLVRHAAAQKAVGTGRASNATKPNATEGITYTNGFLELKFEEYFVEHEVSTAEARNAAHAIDLSQVPIRSIGCGECSRRELEYCETRLLADHCCCERRSIPEPFPWLPHTCYVGPNRCKPLAHDCARYVRLRDCCCYNKLAERWKGILAGRGSRVGLTTGASLLLLSMLLFVAYL